MVYNKITSVIINAGEAYSVTINGVELIDVIMIGLRNGLLELSSIKHINGKKHSVVQYFPLDAIWQFGVCKEILLDENDHHGNEDDEH